MKLFKSPWFYTAVAAIIVMFTPIGGIIGYYSDGFAQRNGATNGKQLAFVFVIATIAPVIFIYFISKYLLRNVRR